MAQATVTIRVDDTLKRNFDSLCDQFGFSNTGAYTLFMKAVVRERRIPFDIKDVSYEEIRAKAIKAFAQMRADTAASGVQDLSLDEIIKEYQEVLSRKQLPFKPDNIAAVINAIERFGIAPGRKKA